MKLPLAEIDLSVLGEEEIEASVGKKQEIRPERPVRNESVKKVEEASVTDILQCPDAKKRKNGTRTGKRDYDCYRGYR